MQYGQKGKLCDRLHQAALEGAGPEQLVEAFASYAKRVFYPTLETGRPEAYDGAYLQRDQIATEKNARQWLWQQCSEFGWFQTYPAEQQPSDSGLRLRRVDRKYFSSLCQRAFGLATEPDVASVQVLLPLPCVAPGASAPPSASLGAHAPSPPAFFGAGQLRRRQAQHVAHLLHLRPRRPVAVGVARGRRRRACPRKRRRRRRPHAGDDAPPPHPRTHTPSHPHVSPHPLMCSVVLCAPSSPRCAPSSPWCAPSSSVLQRIECDDCAHCVDLGHVGFDEQPALRATRAAVMHSLQCWLELPGASNCNAAASAASAASS